MKIDTFTRAYIECALWSTMDQSDENTGGYPLEDNYGIDDIEECCLAQMVEDCRQFQEDNADFMEGLSQYKVELAGHDFWLTRERHGAGFWDGDWPKEIGERLTKYSHEAGGFDLMVDDQGLICH